MGAHERANRLPFWDKRGKQTNTYPSDVALIHYMLNLTVSAGAWGVSIDNMQFLKYCTIIQRQFYPKTLTTKNKNLTNVQIKLNTYT